MRMTGAMFELAIVLKGCLHGISLVDAGKNTLLATRINWIMREVDYILL